MTSGRRRSSAIVATAISFALAACEIPADPEGTFERVEGGTLRVGVIDHPPWADLAGREPKGVEPTLVRRFAEQIQADIEWIPGSESELVEAMTGFQIDVLIGGLTRSSPWIKEVALTRPYIDTTVEVGLPLGSELDGDLSGREIWVERYSAAASLLRQEEDDAEPLPFDQLREVDGPALLESHQIDAIGYERSSYILRDDEHAMAVPMGENRLLVELEQFLLDRGDEAERLLAKVAGS